MILGHTGDWHLHAQGSRPKLSPEGLNQRLMDFYKCARFCVEDVVSRGADVILHAGDFWGGGAGVGLGSRPSPTEVRLVKDALAPAIKAGVPIIAIKGNHDDVRSTAEYHALDHLRGMDGVHVVDSPCILDAWKDQRGLRVEPAPKPEERQENDWTVLQLACLPFPNASRLLVDEDVRKLSPAEKNLVISQKMMQIARGLAADRIEGVPRALLGHFAVDLAQAGQQGHLAMLGGEWSLNLHELESLGFNAILLGHYHKPQALGQAETTVYCGSPEAVTFGEEGEAKRYLLWDIEHQSGRDDPPTVVYESIPTPLRPFLTLVPEHFDEEGQLRDPGAVSDAIVRVKLPATDMTDPRALRQVLEAAGAHEVTIEQERAETVRRRESDVSAGMSLDEGLAAWVKSSKPELADKLPELQAEAREVAEAVGVGGAA